MPTYLTPGVYFESVDASRRGVAAIRTDIAAFVGIAERGPLGVAVRVNSWQQFESAFGTFTRQGYLAYTVKAFFENGGQTCYVVRVAATPRTRTEGAQDPAGASSVVLSSEGFAAEDVVIVTQEGKAAGERVVADVQAGNKLVWDQPLVPDFTVNDPAHPVRFQTGAQPARGVLLDAAGLPTVRVEASSPGSWGNALGVRVARSSPAATRTTGAPQPAGRESSLVESVVGFRPGSLVKAFQEGTPDLVSYLGVTAADTARGRLTWKAPLGVAYDLTKPIFFETVEFALSVYLGGHLREQFTGLSLVRPAGPPGDDEEKPSPYVELAVNGPDFADAAKRAKFPASRLIRVRDLSSPSAVPDNLPDPGATNLTRGALRLTNGRDGLRQLRAEDFAGEEGAPEARGLRALEEVDEVSIVAVPDILARPVPPVTFAPLPVPEPDPCLPCQPPSPPAEPPPPAPPEQVPAFSVEDVFAVQQALVAHCEARRDRIALLDPPVTPRTWVVSHDPEVLAEESVVLGLGEMQSWRQRFDSKYAALYYPWVLASDPLAPGGQTVRAVPPSGHVAGVYARTDRAVGVHKAPANAELEWAQGVSAEVSDAEQVVLNPLGVNVVRVLPGRGIRVYGARTLSSDPSWRYVNVRRLLMMIEEAVDEATQWAVFEPNDFYLRRTLVLAISSFLETLWRRGALAGRELEEAFFVKCDEENNPPAEADLGRVIVDVGVAPSIPSEFVVFHIGKTQGELAITETDWR